LPRLYISFFLCPRYKMAGAYSVTMFRHSVIPSSSVSVQYLGNCCYHLTHIWHMDISQENVVKFEFDHGSMIFNFIFDRVIPLELWIRVRNFQFPFISSPTVVHIQLKFDIWICKRNAQVKFEFVIVRWFFGRVMLLQLWKKKNFSVSAHCLSNNCTHSYQIHQMVMS
jgi:hypothetical protein